MIIDVPSGLSGKRSCDDSHGINLDRVAAAGEVVDLCVQAKKDRAVSLEVTHTLSNLITDVTCIDIREDKCVGITCDLRSGHLLLAYAGRNCCVELHLAVDRNIRIFRLSLLCSVLDLCNGRILSRSCCGEGKESDLGIDTEYLSALSGLACDLDQIILGRIDVDRAVTHRDNFSSAGSSAADQNEAGRYDAVAGFRLDDLQSRTNCISCGICGTAEQAVRNAHLYKHSSEIVSLREDRSCLLGSHSFALSDLAECIHDVIHLFIILGVDDDRSADVVAVFLGHAGDLIRIAQKDGGQEIAGQKFGSSFQNTGIRALGRAHFTAGAAVEPPL